MPTYSLQVISRYKRKCMAFIPRSRPWTRWTSHQKRTFTLIYVVLSLLLLSSIFLIWDPMTHVFRPRLIECFQLEGNVLPVLQENLVPVGQSIFFHETSCFSDKDRSLRVNARQACAVESAALHHPNQTVYLLIPSPVGAYLNVTENKAVKGLLEYGNIQINHINFERYLMNTPMEHLVQGLKRSSYPVSHASDILRYTTLYKFKGTYLDLDVIVLKPLHTYINFAGAESNRSLGAGVINFSDDEVGSAMAEDCARELQRTFDGSDWGTNGPGVLSRVLRKRCNQTGVLDMISANCHGFHVLPVNEIYAFPYWTASMFFKPDKLPMAKKLLESSLVVHFWNKVSQQYSIGLTKSERAGVPFLYYARRHCPRVYGAVRGVF